MMSLVTQKENIDFGRNRHCAAAKKTTILIRLYILNLIVLEILVGIAFWVFRIT